MEQNSKSLSLFSEVFPRNILHLHDQQEPESPDNVTDCIERQWCQRLFTERPTAVHQPATRSDICSKLSLEMYY